MQTEELVEIYHIVEEKMNRTKEEPLKEKLKKILMNVEDEIESRMEFAQFDDYAF